MHGSRDGSISYTRKKSRALSTGRRGEPCTGGLGSSISDLCCLFDDCSRWASFRSAEDDLQLITTSLFTSESDPLTADTLFSNSLFQWSLPISWCPPIADVTAIHCAQTLLVVPGVFAEAALGNGLSESSQSLPSVSVHAKLPSSESILSVSIDFVFAHLISFPRFSVLRYMSSSRVHALSFAHICLLFQLSPSSAPILHPPMLVSLTKKSLRDQIVLPICS